MTDARNIISFPDRRDRRRTYETAFLPAALEVTETPPSPTGRAIAGAIAALFCIALAWSYLGRVDMVASAKGKLIPSGHTKLIQPFETGVVRAIHVHDGQTVKAGERLIELDPTMNNAESKHYQTDLVAAELDMARLKAELADGDALANFKPPHAATPAQLAIQHQFLLNQVAEQQDKLAVLDRQRQQKQAEHETIAATIEKLEASLPILEARLEIRKVLFEHATGSKANYLEMLQPFVEAQHELQVQKRHANETAAAVAALDEQRKLAVQEFRRTRYSELVEAERKAKGFSEDLIRAQHRAALQVLTAPVDGTVQQLAVHTIGGVVTPAQTMLVLVPTDSHLEIEAMILNRDIGFVAPDQKAEIKIDTFNFTRYGLLHGRVLSVSHDAIVHERHDDASRGRRAGTEDDDTSEPNGQELVYAARIALDHAHIDVDGKSVALSPGMAVTVEIQTGSRRIISYLLSPLARYRQDVLRER
jgi:hemolysin D